jgi:WD40 repeat protein
VVDAAWQGEQGTVGKIEALHTLTDHNKAVCALESHGNFIFSGSFDGTIRVWDRVTLSCSKILTGHQGGVCTMAVCCGRLVSGSSDIRVWNLDTWTLERVLKGHNGGVNELAVADNKLLGGFDDALIRVWDTTTWEVERVLEGHVGAVYAIALDDARLYSASFDKCIRVWY